MNFPANLAPVLCIVAILWSEMAPAPSLVGGVTITWQDTPMPQAAVRDPANSIRLFRVEIDG
jgi:hypothetical protein